MELHSPQTDRSPATYAQFVVYNKLLDTDTPEATGKTVAIVGGVPEFRPAPLSERGAYQIVRLHFVNALDAKETPLFSDSQVIEESAYDWSHVQAFNLIDFPIEPRKNAIMRSRRKIVDDQRYVHFITFSVYRPRRLLDLGQSTHMNTAPNVGCKIEWVE